MMPSDLLITLAGLGGRHYGTTFEWLAADEVRGQLKAFGFDVSTQQVAAWLTRLCREDAPRFERQKGWGDWWEYRVTRYGRNDITNHIPKLRFWT